MEEGRPIVVLPCRPSALVPCLVGGRVVPGRSSRGGRGGHGDGGSLGLRSELSVGRGLVVALLLTNDPPGSRARHTGLLLSLLLSGSLLSGLVLRALDRPVKDVVVLESLPNEEVPEELSKVRVVGLVVESERPAVVKVDGELVGESSAEELGRSRHLLFHDPVVLLLLGRRLESLPGKLTSEEVHEDVAERLEVVPSRLLDSEMGVDRRVSGGSGQVLVLSVGDVEVRLGIPVLLGESKVDDVDLVASLSDTHEEVVGLDVSVDEVSRVGVLDSGDLFRQGSVKSENVRRSLDTET